MIFENEILLKSNISVIHSEFLDSENKRKDNIDELKKDLKEVLGIDKIRIFHAFAGTLHGLQSAYHDVGTKRKLGTNQTACILSHLGLWRSFESECSYQGIEEASLVVLEDDAKLNIFDKSEIEEVLSTIPADYEFLYLDSQDFNTFVGKPVVKDFQTRYWYRSETPLRTHAYIIKLSMIRKFIAGKNPLFTKFDQPLDWLLVRYMTHNNIKFYSAEKKIFSFSLPPSTIMFNGKPI